MPWKWKWAVVILLIINATWIFATFGPRYSEFNNRKFLEINKFIIIDTKYGKIGSPMTLFSLYYVINIL